MTRSSFVDGSESGGKQMPLILVVDDEPNLCHAVQRVLEADGYRVATACDGATAIRMLPELKPHLVLLDIMMPGVDGRDVSTAAREVDGCRIVYFTARADLDRPDKARELHQEADAFLTKPASGRRILSVVETTLRGL